jgi:hypothetical protein
MSEERLTKQYDLGPYMNELEEYLRENVDKDHLRDLVEKMENVDITDINNTKYRRSIAETLGNEDPRSGEILALRSRHQGIFRKKHPEFSFAINFYEPEFAAYLQDIRNAFSWATRD